MRILASNPDTIGDMILRQPLYAALLDAGHELMLVVRPTVAPLVPYVAPGARFLTLPFEVYRDDLPHHWQKFDELFREAQAFAPHTLLVAPFRWTLFEEKLAEELPGVAVYGMSGRLYAGDPHSGRPPLSRLRFDSVAQVEEDQPEIDKYAALAAEVVGQPLQLTRPKLEPDSESLEQAKATLDRLGLEPGGFWVADVAGTTNVALKRWQPQRWGEVLSHWASTYGRRFLFVGLPEERPIIQAVREAMGLQAMRSAVWADGAGTLGELLALTALSGGYAGHDTGPMHMAAAAGKPVLAVFGGGTWPRFVPAIEPSCAITVGVPCAGCGWACSFERPHCIEAVPADEVKRAVEDLESGRISGRELRVLPVPAIVQTHMVREAAELVRLQLRETGELSRRLEETRRSHQAEVDRLRTDFDQRLRQIDTQHVQETSRLQQTVERLAERISVLEPKLKPPKQPWKVRFAKWIAGKEQYAPLFGFRSLPKISIVTPVKNGERWLAQTIESVLGQDYPSLEYIVVDGGSGDGTLKIIDAYRDRIDKVISEPDQGMYDAIGKGFDLATGDVFGYLNADDLLEPGALMRVGEYFRDHRRARVIYHEDTVTIDGWRFPNVAQPHVDVYKLLSGHVVYQDGVFFRKSGYRMVGGVNRDLRRAGDADLWLRMARMFGMRRVPGHVSSFRTRPEQISEDRAAYAAEQSAARQAFLGRFGLSGRLRCRVIAAINLARNGIERLLVRRKLFWPIDYCGKPYPPGEAPPLVPGQPVCTLTGRPPDRLLFSTRDTRFGDPRIHYVYYDSQTAMAMAYPPMSPDELGQLYERHYSQPSRQVTCPDPGYHSPYRNYRGGNFVARNLSRIPSPWWWFRQITHHDTAAQELLQSVRRTAPAQDAGVRFLDVGCFEGTLLDDLNAKTKWKLFGLEANSKAVHIARGKGHTVWHATAQEAPLVVPEPLSFDVIYMGQTMEHLDDPLAALNRLRLLLAPGGTIVVSVPNLDSKQVELFGPTWAHWHLPYHRTLLSRRALRRMAKLAGMRVERLRTRTHTYWSTMSVQLNRLGLGAAVPHTALFPDVISMHGVRLTGWARLLWDWRGRGDYMIAVLREA